VRRFQRGLPPFANSPVAGFGVLTSMHRVRVAPTAVRVGLLVAVLGLLATACGDGSDDGSEPGEVVLHDNLLAILQAPPPISQTNPPPQPSLTFQFEYSGQYSVSTGQPWEGVSTQPGMPPTVLDIIAMAGRHKTTPPATWFNDATLLRIGYALEDTRPEELFFAFSGNLVINGTPYQVYLGQGSSLFTDDWWLGVPNTEPPWTLTAQGYLQTPDGKYIICQKNGGYYGAHDNAFQVITPELSINCEQA
jgi:hypothetical protein